MSIAYSYSAEAGAAPFVVVPAAKTQALHRLAELRRQQGVSRNTVASQLNIGIEQVREQESAEPRCPA